MAALTDPQAVEGAQKSDRRAGHLEGDGPGVARPHDAGGGQGFGSLLATAVANVLAVRHSSLFGCGPYTVSMTSSVVGSPAKSV